jgi:sugar lactone lactonase YvrE
VPDFDKHNVLRYDATTGAFVDEFVPRHSGGLNQPWNVVIGPHDGNLYIPTGHFRGPGQAKAVLRFDGTTGAFVDEFVERGQMDMPHAVTFGPDGNLYVGDRVEENNSGVGGRILRIDATTGEIMGEFVTEFSGGLLHPLAHLFGPDGDLYVTDEGEPGLGDPDIKRYDGTTGAFKGSFVATGSGGLSAPLGLAFGPDGNLYVADFGIGAILRYQGPSGSMPGAPMPSAGNSGAVFVAPGSGGLLARPLGVIFGPDGNSDGEQDIYVSNITFTGFYGKDGNVKRYDGLTGAFIDTFVPAGSGGLDDPNLISFTETDPVTLAYNGGENRFGNVGGTASESPMVKPLQLHSAVIGHTEDEPKLQSGLVQREPIRFAFLDLTITQSFDIHDDDSWIDNRIFGRGRKWR